MAAELGISAMYISEIENGKKTPLRGEILPRVAAYLGLDPAEIVRMAYAEKANTRLVNMEDDLSLSVARKAMEEKDPEILTKIMKIFEGKAV
jgi:transcriptional regulator with XRE-family HTH domain